MSRTQLAPGTRSDVRIRTAVAEDCEVFHLDSGVQRKRAHQFYLREGLELAGYHFSERLKPRA